VLLLCSVRGTAAAALPAASTSCKKNESKAKAEQKQTQIAELDVIADPSRPCWMPAYLCRSWPLLCLHP
jgi:hypothetical protein